MRNVFSKVIIIIFVFSIFIAPIYTQNISPALASHPGQQQQQMNDSTRKRVSDITKVLRSNNSFNGVFLWALAISFLLGSLHALTPGHGKTLVAAYLVGQHGTKKDALILALTTTVTHTSSIYLLGALSIFATKYFVPEKIIPLLELLSALLIFGMGIWLFSKRLEEFKKNKQDNHVHDHEHEHDHDHPHDHTHSEQDHDHIHTLSELKDKPKSLKSIISLGFSGGIIPCTEALAMMVIAIGLNKVIEGMILILFFSMGLAAVLASIGLVIVTSKSIFEKYVPSQSITRFFPLISSVIIVLIGTMLVLKVMKIT